MKAYWTYLEKIREECYGTEKPGAPDHDPMEFYNEQRVGTAFALLDKAKQAVQGAPKYLRRVEFARVGLEFTKLYTEIVLRGSGAIVSSRGFPGGDKMGFQRMEFEAVTDVQTLDMLGTEDAATPQVGDISSMLHVKWGANSEGSPLKQGCFFQFGGFLNTRNKLLRAWKLLEEERDPAVKIVPGKVHKIVVENDGGVLRLKVEAATVLSHKEDASLLGGGHDKVGLYCYTDCKIRNVRVYVKTVACIAPNEHCSV